MRSIVRASLFRLVQLAWAPIAVAGYPLFVARLIIVSRRSAGVSMTTLASLYTRWMQHELRTRLDGPCARLMTVLPYVPRSGLRILTKGTLLAHQLTGYVPRIYRYPYEGNPPLIHESSARTTFFDAALGRHIGAIDQLVVLGAGYDTRSYRVPERIHCFEIDTPRTQQTKVEMLRRAGLDTTETTFVPADLMTDDWLQNLVDAGFDPARPTFFLWEAVTMYLDRDAVERSLRRIAGTAPGSAVAFDYFNAELLESPSLVMRYARAVLNALGEPFRFGIDSAPPTGRAVAEFLASCGLTMEEQRNFGPETRRKPAMAGFTTAIV